MSRFARKVDANHSAIVKALRKVGCSVQSLAAVGDGVPDILVGLRGRNWIMEIKDGSKPPSQRKLTPKQEKWRREWRGEQPVEIETVAQALAVIAATSWV